MRARRRQYQARAILDMTLRRLTGLERDKIKDEYAELMKQIGRPQGLSSDGSRQRNIWQLLSDCHADRRARRVKLHFGGKNVWTLAHQPSG